MFVHEGVFTGVDVMIAPDKRDTGQFLPLSHFGYGILTWHLPMLFALRRATTYWSADRQTIPKDAVYPLEGIVETDWASSANLGAPPHNPRKALKRAAWRAWWGRRSYYSEGDRLWGAPRPQKGRAT